MAGGWKNWNPITSYETYKDIENEENSKSSMPFEKELNESKAVAATKSTTLWSKLKGTFFMFSGYLGKSPRPDNYYVKNFVLTPTIMDNIASKARHNRLNNHYGVYDWCTLFIPYAIEAFFRGNWGDLLSRNAQQNMQWFFTIIPIVPALAIIRNSIGFVATVVASPVVLALHGIEWIDEKVQAWKQQKAIAHASSFVASFNYQYKQLKALLKIKSQDQSVFSNLSDEERKAIIANAAKLRTTLGETAENLVTLPKYVKIKTPGYYFRSKKSTEDNVFFKSVETKLAKITNDNGKYSAQAFERSFPRK